MMPNNLGREKLWNDDLWGEIDKAVTSEVGRIRVAQKVFPGSQNGNSQYVPSDVLDLSTMTIAEGRTTPYVEISVEFSLTQGQVDNEAAHGEAKVLARLAGKSIALAEDKLFFQGAGAKLERVVRVVNRESVGHGLLGIRGIKTVEVPPLDKPAPKSYGGNTFKAVAEAIAQLTDDAQPGPYALVLESSLFADAYAPLWPDTLTTTADRLVPLLPGGFYATGTMPPSTGLLVSLGGEPTSLYVGQDAVTAYTQEDADGNARFRVFERVQLIARDHRAFVRLAFQ
jgi:uncharacterized linocin/CFP29 family protein